MKRIIVLISLLGVLIGQSPVKAQTPDKEQTQMINIRPFGSDDVIKSVKYGERVKFIIWNVNTFKINGLVASKPVNIDFEVPTIFNEVINSIAPEIPKKDKSDKKKALVTPKVSLLKVDTITKMQTSFIKDFEVFLERYQKINVYTGLEDNLNRQLSDSIFIRNIEVLKANCASEYEASYGDELDFIRDKKKISEDLSEIDKRFTSLKLTYEELQNMQEDASFMMSGTLQTTDKKNSLNVKNAEVKLETKKYFEDEYLFAKKVYDQLNDVKNRKALVEKAYAGIDLYNKIQMELFISYTDSEPVNADEITLTPTLKYANGKVAKEFSPYHIRTIGGVKVNFSSGYLLSFVGDDNYTLYKDSNGNTGASKGNSNKLTHGLGALAHVYCRTDKDYNWALSTGISLANNSNLAFYLGGSLMFTEKNRIVISSGISLNQVQRLNTYNLQTGTGDKYTFLSASDNTIKYDQVYRPAVFISVTYNLSGNK